MQTLKSLLTRKKVKPVKDEWQSSSESISDVFEDPQDKFEKILKKDLKLAYEDNWDHTHTASEVLAPWLKPDNTSTPKPQKAGSKHLTPIINLFSPNEKSKYWDRQKEIEHNWMMDKRNFYWMFYMSQFENKQQVPNKPKVLCRPFLRRNYYSLNEPALLGYNYVYGL